MPYATFAIGVAWDTFDYTAGWESALTYESILGDVKSISTRRGRSSDMGSIQQGICTLRLADLDGTYNPFNESSSLREHNSFTIGYGLMRPLRITATYGVVTYPMFQGYITRISHDPSPSVKESTIEAVDLSYFLNLRQPTIATLTNQTVGQILAAILDAVGFDSTLWADCDAGDTIASWDADGSKSALALITELVEVDGGMAFVSGAGKLTYLGRGVLNARGVLKSRGRDVATFTDAMFSGLQATVSVDDLVNRQTVTRTGGVAQTYEDTGSQQTFGLHEGGAIESAYLASDGAALSLATYIVKTKAFPHSPARDLEFWNDDAARLTQMLERELGDLVAVSSTVGGTAFSGLVANVEHQVTQAGLIHQTTFAVQQRVVPWLTIGVSIVDVPEVGPGETAPTPDVIGY